MVTGATGLVGGWLVAQLLEDGADVVCLIRDWVPQSNLILRGMTNRVKVVRGDVCDQAVVERALGAYEVDTVLHLAALVGLNEALPAAAACRRSSARGTSST